MFDFFNRIFGKTRAAEAASEAAQPSISFGRFTDIYKTKEQYAAWDASLELFEKGERAAAWKRFFDYLNDPNLQNARAWEEDEVLHFELFQGSKRIVGKADGERIRAESLVAKAPDLKVGLLRRLVEQNYNLKYSRFALSPEGDIAVVFDSFLADASPYKLYFGLKELAVNADKQDDLLLEEFKNLESIDSGIKQFIDENERVIKVEWLQKRLAEVFELMDSGKLKADQHPGAYAYLLLGTAYKLDFLLHPEGFALDTFERIHRNFFAADGKTKQAKNLEIRRDLQKILDRKPEDWQAELYQTKSVFGVASPVNHDRVVAFIDGELGNMDWYLSQKHLEIARAVPSYIVSHCLFNYAMPKPDRDLFQLFLQIDEADFFKKLGFENGFWENGQLSKKAILAAIEKIVAKNQAQFPQFLPETKMLRFENLESFGQSFLRMVRELNLTKAD